MPASALEQTEDFDYQAHGALGLLMHAKEVGIEILLSVRLTSSMRCYDLVAIQIVRRFPCTRSLWLKRKRS